MTDDEAREAMLMQYLRAIQADTIDDAIRRIHTVVNDAVAQLNTQLKEHVHDRQT